MRMDSTPHEGRVQVTAVFDKVEEARVIQQVAAEACGLRMKAIPSGNTVTLETDPVRDCSGNALPDGTVVSFTKVDRQGKSTVDTPIKKGVARVAVQPARAGADQRRVRRGAGQRSGPQRKTMKSMAHSRWRSRRSRLGISKRRALLWQLAFWRPPSHLPASPSGCCRPRPTPHRRTHRHDDRAPLCIGMAGYGRRLGIGSIGAPQRRVRRNRQRSPDAKNR